MVPVFQRRAPLLPTVSAASGFTLLYAPHCPDSRRPNLPQILSPSPAPQLQRPIALLIPLTTPIIPNILPLSRPPSVFIIPDLPQGQLMATPPRDGVLGEQFPRRRPDPAIAPPIDHTPPPQLVPPALPHAYSPELQRHVSPVPVQPI
ncbi:hypothetical protein C0993_007351 [Termitomyces sp. T159_Od127]|nr:hypothetical protein C0993_007351 [Termitomyces sp. T159_Od127]